MSAVGNLFKSEHATTGLYIGIIGAAIGELAPKPTDVLNFKWEREWRMQLQLKQITPEEYYKRTLIAYYVLPMLWWLFVLVMAMSFGKSIESKAIIVGVIVAAGALVGVIAQNIEKDKEFLEKYELVEKK